MSILFIYKMIRDEIRMMINLFQQQQQQKSNHKNNLTNFQSYIYIDLMYDQITSI